MKNKQIQNTISPGGYIVYSESVGATKQNASIVEKVMDDSETKKVLMYITSSMILIGFGFALSILHYPGPVVCGIVGGVFGYKAVTIINDN